MCRKRKKERVKVDQQLLEMENACTSARDFYSRQRSGGWHMLL